MTFGFFKEDYLQFLYLLQGYLRINVYPIKNRLCPIQEIKSSNLDALNSKFFYDKQLIIYIFKQIFICFWINWIINLINILFYLYIVSVFLVKYPQINDKELLEEEKLAENCCNLKMNDYTIFKLNETETETIREANKEELVIYETTNMVYEDLNELTQKIVLKSVTDDDELNFESLALIESCHIVNQNDLSDLKSIQEEEEEEVTDNNNFIDEEQQTDDIIYCFDFKNMSSILINTEDEKDDTISISSFDNNNNESNNSNNNNNNKKTEIINSSSPLPFEQIKSKYLNIL